MTNFGLCDISLVYSDLLIQNERIHLMNILIKAFYL